MSLSPRQILNVVLALAMSCSALKMTDGFECTQGSCFYGYGTATSTQFDYSLTGNWKNAQTIPNESYVLTHPNLPGKKFEQVFDADGFLVKGTMFRKATMGSAVPRFTGSFTKIHNTIYDFDQATFSEGTYDNGVGLVYKGSFEYLPVGPKDGMSHGIFIFYGEFKDVDEDSTQTGLYVSDATTAGFAIKFFPADASYLKRLEQTYASNSAEMQDNSGGFFDSVFPMVMDLAGSFTGLNIPSEARNNMMSGLVSGVLKNGAKQGLKTGSKELVKKWVIDQAKDVAKEKIGVTDDQVKLVNSVVKILDKAK